MMYPRTAAQVRIQANRRLQTLNEKLTHIEELKHAFRELHSELYPKAIRVALLYVKDCKYRNRNRLEFYTRLLPPQYQLRIKNGSCIDSSVTSVFIGLAFKNSVYLECPAVPRSEPVEDEIKALKNLLSLLPPTGEVFLTQEEMTILGDLK